MPKTLISDQIKNVYQKIIFFLTSDNKLYKTTEDGNNDDTEVTTIANNITWSGNQVFNGTLSGTAIKDEDDFVSNSNTAVPTQQSTKLYVNNTIQNSPVMITPSMSTPVITGNVALARNVDIIFEGDTLNDHETTLTVEGPTADRTVTLSDETYTIYPSKDEDDMTSNSARHTATQQSIKAYVDNAGGQPSSIVLAGTENGVSVTGENNKWALVHMCTADQNHRLLVHISFASGGSNNSIIASNGLSLNGAVGLTINYIGMSSGDKLQISKICGDSAVTFAAVTLTP